MVLFAGVAVVLAQRGGGLAAALPVLGAVALGALRLLPVLQQLYYGWSMLAGNRAVAAQVIEWLRLPLAAEDQDRANLRPLEFNSELRFDDVSFAYRADQRPAVDRVSLTIARGSSVALMGRSGSGKSTLADLLMGLLEPDEGQISVDGVPLTAATRRRWRRSIAHVPQAVFLADASIARNIAFGSREEDIDPVRLREAARIAQLDEVIAGLPEGFATFVGERGIRLSGGQRQRLGIARAIYKDAPVLILDEATSALDEQTEAALLEALTSSGSERRTMLVIAHRRSTIEHCDRVLRIEAGRLTETYRLGAASQESTRRGEA
jgi:ABC-type multidrug transport system fused ATPase/permease subunit